MSNPQDTATIIDEIERNCFSPTTPFFGKHYLPLTAIEDEHQATLWMNYGPYVGSVDDDGNKFLWAPRTAHLTELAWMHVQRLRSTLIGLVGPAGTGKTTVCLDLVKRWRAEGPDFHAWLCAPTNKACGVLRDKAREAHCILPATAVQTPHTRFDLADRYGSYDLEPRWWPKPPNEGRSTQRRLYIIDEVFAWGAATLAYSLACIPTGAWVILAGDWRQLRPVDGTLMAQHLFDIIAERVRLPSEDSGTEALWHAMGRNGNVSARTAGSISNLAPGKIPVIELTTIKRVRPRASALAKVGPAISVGEFPQAGPGLKITHAANLDAAVALACERLRASTDWSCVVPTNALACRVTGELNRRNTFADELTFDGFGLPEQKLRALEECLYFRAGDTVEVLVSDHAKGIRNGDKVKYVRWCRPNGQCKDYFHEVEVTAPEFGMWSRPRVRLTYTPGRYSQIMRASLEQLARDYAEDDLAALLATEQAASVRGLLCSPRVQTNHRAQGSTYKRVVVIIPLWERSPWMCDSWLYVALSRAAEEAEIIFAGRPDLTSEQHEAVTSFVKARLLKPQAVGPNPFRMIDS